MNKSSLKYTQKIILLCIILILCNNYGYTQQFSIVGCKKPYESSYCTMQSIDNKLYHSGIYEMCGDVIGLLATWDDSLWTGGFGEFRNGSVMSLIKYNGDLYAGGGFHQ